MKKIILILCCLVLTGCNVNYYVNINDDLSIIESMIVKGDTELYESSYRTSKNKILQEFLDIYGESLEQNNYEYKLEKGEDPYVYIKHKFNNVKDYLDSSKLFNDYFDRIDYQVNGKKIKIETIGFNYSIADDPERFYVDNLNIVIKVPFKVINHNANRVDEDTNTYYYNINNETQDFKLLLEFDSGIKFNANSKNIIKILILVLIIILTWVMIYYLNRQKKYKI